MASSLGIVRAPAVADTAFMISWMRSSNPQLSQDHWGHLWTTDVAKEIGAAYAEVTGPLNVRACCLRHRFFSETALAFERVHKNMALVNIGAGFTSYPFLLGREHLSIEIDLPPIIEFRQQRIRELVSAGKIPERNIEFVSLDLESSTVKDELAALFRKLIVQRPTLVIMEGLLYYLTERAVNHLFATLSAELVPGDRIATVAWAGDLRQTTMFQNIDRYFQVRLGRPPQHYTFLGRPYFESRPGLRLVEELSYPVVESRYAEEQELTPRSYLDERMYVLERLAQDDQVGPI